MASDLPAECTQEAAPRCLAGEFTMRSICAVSALDGFPRAPTFAGRSGMSFGNCVSCNRTIRAVFDCRSGGKAY